MLFATCRNIWAQNWERLTDRCPTLCYWLLVLGVPVGLLTGVTASVCIFVLPVSLLLGWL